MAQLEGDKQGRRRKRLHKQRPDSIQQSRCGPRAGWAHRKSPPSELDSVQQCASAAVPDGDLHIPKDRDFRLRRLMRRATDDMAPVMHGGVCYSQHMLHL